jgi:Fur family ferric uptake transcriptional regulator
VCLQCGRVEEFYDSAIEQRQQRVAAEHGFELQEHALALYGICKRPHCKYRPR